MSFNGLELGESIRVFRVRNKVTQSQLAETCHLSRNTISEIERGHGNPTLSTMQLIAHALNMRLDIELSENENE